MRNKKNKKRDAGDMKERGRKEIKDETDKGVEKWNYRVKCVRAEDSENTRCGK